MQDDSATLGPTRLMAGWLLALGGPALLTAVMLPHQGEPALGNEAMLFLGLTVAVALVGGRWPAVVAAAVGAVLLNVFFTPPLHTLAIQSGEDVLAIVVFVVTALAVSAVVDSAATRLRQAEQARHEAETLAMLNRTVLGGELGVEALLALVRTTFRAGDVALVSAGTAPEPHPDVVVAPAGRELALVVRGPSLSPADHRIASAFASHLGVLTEREEMGRQVQAARELEAGNRTRTALLAAVSHDLRTPLAEIRAAVDTLQLAPERLAAGDHEMLLDTVGTATTRLTRIVTDLLDMSRLQTGAVSPITTGASLRDVVEQALRGLPQRDLLTVADDLPEVLCDPALLERVVENLASNAIRHGGGGEVFAVANGPRVRLVVADHGPGVPEADLPRLFEPFQRLGDVTAGEGIGLGLAVARGLTEAQGATLTASPTPGGGLTMTVELAAP